MEWKAFWLFVVIVTATLLSIFVRQKNRRKIQQKPVESLSLKQPTFPNRNFRSPSRPTAKLIWEEIPSEVRRLLYTSAGEPKDFGPGAFVSIKMDLDKGVVFSGKDIGDDPSTIYFKQALKIPVDPKGVSAPPYFPSYAGLSPEQKWLYLSWLKNIRDSIDIGFVFIFYYGLERHLLLGNFNEAFDMILSLRKAHINASFQKYSILGLTYGAIFKNRPDRITDLMQSLYEDRWGNEHVLISAKLGGLLTADDLAKLVLGIKGLNCRYLKRNQHEYILSMAGLLEERYGKPTLDPNQASL